MALQAIHENLASQRARVELELALVAGANDAGWQRWRAKPHGRFSDVNFFAVAKIMVVDFCGGSFFGKNARLNYRCEKWQ